jgi:hypothetical protein
MIRHLIHAAFLFSLVSVLSGCSKPPEPKTQDPVEIEKIQKEALQNSQRERSTTN